MNFFRRLSLFSLCLFSLLFSSLSIAQEGANESIVDHSGHMGNANQNAADSPMDHSQHMPQGEGMDHSQHMAQGEGMDHSQHAGHDHSDHKMTLDAEGMVMNWNDEQLPNDCQSLNKEYQFTVRAGVKYAEPFNGTVFGFDQHEFYVEPCSKVTVTFINEDEIRHQWMMHGLPKYIYQQGMFHLEAAGGATKVGTFIVPSGDKTYLVHCDIAQHMENGMKSQLVVGKGSGDLTSIPGVTGSIWPDQYAVPGGFPALLLVLFFGLVFSFVLVRKFSF
jgi:hypothetical protein